NAQSVLFKDHIDWLTSWYDSRSHQFLITGAGEESSGNNNCQATINDKDFFNLRLRLPDNINKNSKDKFLTIKDVDFGKNNSLLHSSLSSETKEVRILTIAEKIEIKELKNTVSELKKAKFSLIKEIKLLKKSHLTNSDKLNDKLSKLDNEIINLQKDIEIKSNIFLLPNNETNKKLNNYVLEKDLLRTRKKKIAIPITYRFVKNTDRNSPKYGTWSVHFTVEVKEPEIITDISLGSIGVDLNENHLALTEVDSAGKIIQSFNIYLNPETYNSENNQNIENKPFRLIDSNNNSLITLPMIKNQFKLNEKIDKKSNISLSKISSDKTQNILGNAIKVVTDLSLRTGKPIIIEKLDFTQKKKQLASNFKLNNKKFNYNHMISSFAYSKFKEILKSQAARSGLQVIEVNPAYSSLIGLVNYIKPLGLSIHMAASYVIAQRGLNKNKLNNYKIDEKPRLIVVKENKLNKNKIEIYTKSKVYLLDYIVNSHLTEDISNNYHNDNLNEWSVISNLYKTLQKDIHKENLLKSLANKKAIDLMKSLPALSNELDLSYLFSEDSLPVIDT
ncbi:MAG: IS200/IS605 family element transposase accessory protein TnpB, partial [Candidatus Sericytochromatia bacterium]|nr:IS200/IS605 family element transposase accessory protein TnpB [Candidatus Sericytochromatia bacterium]